MRSIFPPARRSVLAAALLVVPGVVHAATERVSVASGGWQTTGRSGHPEFGAHGNIAVFSSTAPDLVPGDTNRVEDVFFRDLVNGLTYRINLGPFGVEANGTSLKPVPSADSSIISFQSRASNLVPVDANGAMDVFVRDIINGTTTRISNAWFGADADGPSSYAVVSADGRFVAFQSDATNIVANDLNRHTDVFVHDRATGLTSLVSGALDGTPGNGVSKYPTISADGRFVAFQSAAANLVADDTNNRVDVFVRDLWTGLTERVSLSALGAQGNSASGYPYLSGDGRFVVFVSGASTLIDGDTNRARDIYLYDRALRTIERLSVATGGAEANGISLAPEMSDDARFVTFRSEASNLVADDTNGLSDVFLRDRWLGTTVRVSVGSEGQQGTAVAYQQTISGDGQVLIFSTMSPNLVPDDTNGTQDVFIWRP